MSDFSIKNIKKVGKTKAKKKRTKEYTGLRVFTRKIIRNKLKFELKKLGYHKVNKNFRYILANMTDKEKLKLLNK